MSKIIKNFSKGFSLVEIIIAVAVFLIFLVAISDLTFGFWRQTRNAVNKERATYLAGEAVEAMRNLRDSDFANLADGTHGVKVLSSEFILDGASDITDIFTRQITISTINENQKKVDVVVSWADQSSPTNSVTLSTYLTDWRKTNPLGGLTILKTVINHGEAKTAADFALYTVSAYEMLGDPPVSTLVTTPMTLGVAVELSPNTYTVSETTDSNYTTTFTGDCNSSGVVVIATGDAKVCTIINEEKASQLTVNKVVTNHGLSKTALDFALFVDASPIVSGETNTFNSGLHTVSETADASYNTTFSGDCNSSGVVTLTAGSTKVCTVTNEEKRAYITINKTVTNHGSSNTSSAFSPYKIDGNTVTLGASSVVNSGSHTITETNTPNYSQTFSGDCNSSGVVSISSGESKTCTITNEENLAYVTVNKSVINHGGSATTSTFAPYKIDATEVSLGVSNGFNSGTYTVSETTDSDYVQTFSDDCNSSGVINLTSGTSKVCSITNEQKHIPTVTSPTSTSITSTSAILGANVTSLGLPAVISARGVCYGATANPTSNCTAEGGTTTGVFTQSISSLSLGTLYYYRGYATNTKGTAYSADGTFTTKCSGASAIVGTPTVYDGNNVSSALVTKPTGVTTGDIMFAHIMHFNSPDRLAIIPAGWIQLGRHKNNSYNQALYYKVAGASEPINYTFGLSTNSRLAVTISAYRGCFDTQNPIDTFSNVEYITSNTTYRAGTVTSSYANSTVLMFPSRYDSTVRVFANPLTQSGGWTEDYDHGNNQSRFSRAGYRKFISSAGVIGVIDSIGTTGTTVKHAFGVVLKPAQ